MGSIFWPEGKERHVTPKVQVDTVHCIKWLYVSLTATCVMPEHPMVLQVQYAALHNFEDREEDFRADVVTLRRRFTSDGMHLCIPVPSRIVAGCGT